MAILDELRQLASDLEQANLAEIIDHGHKLRSLANRYATAVSFELDECCAGHELTFRGRRLIGSTKSVNDAAEIRALEPINGPVRVTVIVQPLEDKPQPSTRAAWLNVARDDLNAGNTNAALDALIKAMGIDQ